jgi:hypothetical protein
MFSLCIKAVHNNCAHPNKSTLQITLYIKVHFGFYVQNNISVNNFTLVYIADFMPVIDKVIKYERNKEKLVPVKQSQVNLAIEKQACK